MEEPLAIIKVTFDDVPDELKNKINLFFNVMLVFLVLLNVLIVIYIMDNVYRKTRKYVAYINNRNEYQRV